ncbi:MAG: alpha/beta hydrolase-fold protein [Candidatus Sericytochromatia bacterium]
MDFKTKKLTLKNKVFSKIPRHHHLKGTIVRHHINSRHLNNSRDLDIYLPPTYFKNPCKRYPVLYMHDGNNLFYPQIAFAGVPWKVDITVDNMINNRLIEEIIVVGIHNTMGRNYEYTWTEMHSYHGKEGGGGSRYAKFLTEEVKPFIDYKFRTLNDRNNTAVMGSSLGGLISFYLGLHNPDVFGKIGMISPSLWWDKGIAFKHVFHIIPHLQIWLDMGTKEGYTRKDKENINILMTRFMKEHLIRLGYREGYNLGYLEEKGGMHNEYWWGKRLHMPLIFFFGKRKSLIFSKK